MLGVILLYVGMVLMSNGLHRLEGIPDKSNVVMNIFTGGLGLILNIIVIAYGACTGQGAEWFMVALLVFYLLSPIFTQQSIRFSILINVCMGGLVYLWQLIRYQQGFFA